MTEISFDDRILVQVDPDLEDLIPGFLVNRERDLTQIRDASERKDFALIRTLGHGMKGAGVAYGFDGLTDLGARIEEAALSTNLQEVLQLTEALAIYLSRVEVIDPQTVGADTIE